MRTRQPCISGASTASNAQGIDRYEISNVARAGRESRHNLKYWQDGEWLGFGCGAHSTREGVRWKNVSATEDYVRTVTAGGSLVTERRTMTPTERLEEALFTGLRLTEGVDIAVTGGGTAPTSGRLTGRAWPLSSPTDCSSATVPASV